MHLPAPSSRARHGSDTPGPELNDQTLENGWTSAIGKRRRTRRGRHRPRQREGFLRWRGRQGGRRDRFEELVDKYARNGGVRGFDRSGSLGSEGRLDGTRRLRSL
ncbi:hypothetical protein BRADI_4g13993v3 [Brachypodium distachyon]|uniref:Uncharacterized protein n=1 Tax=Brachypodium distachyon TaxID=15368 RepID=A0A2K2CMR4_BRADI|nr:hypothetical protein BRADI_4g13993v3 [Brachypodium distachyon]